MSGRGDTAMLSKPAESSRGMRRDFRTDMPLWLSEVQRCGEMFSRSPQDAARESLEGVLSAIRSGALSATEADLLLREIVAAWAAQSVSRLVWERVCPDVWVNAGRALGVRRRLSELSGHSK